MKALTPAFELEDICKRFGQTTAVDHVTLRVEQGAFLGLLGRNGAGKTTTIHMATGILRPTSGRVRVLGLDVTEHPIEVKRQIGVMPQEDSLLDYLTGPQYLQFVGGVYGLAPDVIASRGRELSDLLDLTPAAGTLVREYSYGMKKKLGLASALIHSPRVLFLDEPFEGIDPLAARTIRELLVGLPSRGITIVMTSHVLEIVEKLCDPIAIIDHGRLVACGSLSELEAHHGAFSNLEDLFVSLMGGARKGELSWL